MFEKMAIQIAIEKAPGILWHNIDWLWVFLLTLVSFALGMAWHQKHLLGRIWVAENYPNGFPEKKDMNLPLMLGGSAVSHFVLLMTLSAIVSGRGAGLGTVVGLILWVVFVVTTMAPNYFFASKSWKLLLVDAGFYGVLMTCAGALLGFF